MWPKWPQQLCQSLLMASLTVELAPRVIKKTSRAALARKLYSITDDLQTAWYPSGQKGCVFRWARAHNLSMQVWRRSRLCPITNKLLLPPWANCHHHEDRMGWVSQWHWTCFSHYAEGGKQWQWQNVIGKKRLAGMPISNKKYQTPLRDSDRSQFQVNTHIYV